MRDKFIISLTDIKGPRHYVFPAFIRRIFVFSVVLLTFLGPASFSWLLFLNNDLESLISDKDHTILSLREKYTSILSENHLLSAEAEGMSRKIVLFHDKMSKIENILKLDNSKVTHLAARIKEATLVLVGNEEESRNYKKTIAEIGQITGKKITNSNGLMGRLKVLRWDMKRKKQMLDNIPNGYPIPFRGITSPFGTRYHPTLKKKAFHSGIDLRAEKGTAVRAPADGVVEYAGFHQKSGLGILLILRHSFGFSSVFGHLNRLEVHSGDMVAKGDLVAYTGNSGLSAGPHLHYEVRFLFKSLDPGPFLKWGWDNFDIVFQKEKEVNWMSLQKLLDPPTPQASFASLARAENNARLQHE